MKVFAHIKCRKLPILTISVSRRCRSFWKCIPILIVNVCNFFRWRYWAESVKPQFERDFPAQSCSNYNDFEKGRCYGNRMNFMGLAANSRWVSFSFRWYSRISSLFVSSSRLIWTELPAHFISNYIRREISKLTSHITSIFSLHSITEVTWWGYSRYFKDFLWVW